jgi:hypothetical protein
MYDLEKEFKIFYYNHVVLPKNETNNLREKKKLNLKRLREGLEEYNVENNTSYKIAEEIEQGSVAMSTVTQNEENDYDIDVAIVFDASNIEEIGAIAIKNVIVDALKRKCTNFKTEPEAKTNCVRIVYSDNYHIDFAIYRRSKNKDGSYYYEHAGSIWRTRDPRAINNWFKDQLNEHSEKLRQTVRLSKMFCRSRSSWNMPGGLIISVLADECIQSFDRIDEMFYYTLNEIKKRLANSIEVSNPTDTSQSLLLTQNDRNKMTNLYNRLVNYLSKLNVLFEESCTYKEAREAWFDFFNHSYWEYDVSVEKCASALHESSFTRKFINYNYEDNEEFIENFMPVKIMKKVSINCKVVRNGKYYDKLRNMLSRNEKIKIGDSLYFYIESTNIYGDYEIFLKVKNNGSYAEQLNQMRGEIFNIKSYTMYDNKYHYEEASFKGDHYVECYIQQNKVCVARDFLRVPIV